MKQKIQEIIYNLRKNPKCPPWGALWCDFHREYTAYCKYGGSREKYYDAHRNK